MTEQQRKAAAVVMASDGPWDVYEGPTRGWAPVDGTPLWDWEDHTYRIRPAPAPAPLPCPVCRSYDIVKDPSSPTARRCGSCMAIWQESRRAACPECEAWHQKAEDAGCREAELELLRRVAREHYGLGLCECRACAAWRARFGKGA